MLPAAKIVSLSGEPWNQAPSSRWGDRVLRGGAHNSTLSDQRSAYRTGGGPTLRGHNVGFRCVRAAVAGATPSAKYQSPLMCCACT